ncbi:MAG: DUF3386 domain-containing protein [Thermomicrobium sp.]|nr:DUF3386 domain-containing protein [Thermomicrobium sp.]MDW7982595.1 DUF3386 family protein [Thermomicrobium sp.]
MSDARRVEDHERAVAEARRVLEAVSHRRYRYPAQFPGFSAAVSARSAGERLEGTVRVLSFTDVAVEPTAPAALTDWVRTVIATDVAHRMPRPAAERGTARLIRHPDDPLGDEIELLGDPLQSRYRVVDDAVVVVERIMGADAFTIAVLDHWVFPEDRIVPRAFAVVFRDRSDGAIRRVELHAADYVEKDGLWLLARYSQTDLYPGGRLESRELTLTEHRLLAL